MVIGGLEKFSLIDYPDHISAIIFTQGCNFRCHFCYNPMLVLPQGIGKLKYSSSLKKEGEGKDHSLILESGLFRFLKSRQGKLDAVVITGGEPTLHSDLEDFVKKIKELGYLVKLDTNGTNPDMLEDLINKKIIDYVAMDIKSTLKKYSKTVGVDVNLKNIQKSVNMLLKGRVPYEFRSTIVPGLINIDDIDDMGLLIKDASKWYLQNFKSNTDLVDGDYKGGKSYTAKDMEKMVEIGKKYVDICEVRG